jgi:hypothetical protein
MPPQEEKKKFELDKNVKALSPNSVKIYKRDLNFLAENGYDTFGKIKRSPKKIIKLMNETLEGAQSQRFRQFLCAIFYAASATDYCTNDKTKNNLYYKEFQKHKNIIPKPEED